MRCKTEHSTSSEADKRFFALLRKHFTYEEVTKRASCAVRNSLSEHGHKVDDDPARKTYSRESIFLYRVSRKNSVRVAGS
jgi:hypothetical protein